MMSETIKCCPFCGSHEVQVCRTNPDACWIRWHYNETPAVIVDDGDKPLAGWILSGMDRTTSGAIGQP